MPGSELPVPCLCAEIAVCPGKMHTDNSWNEMNKLRKRQTGEIVLHNEFGEQGGERFKKP